jgi:pyroglutamyl-peptidase
MSILVTGFQPFGDFSTNLSEQVARLFDGISLPVVRTKSFDVFRDMFLILNPEAVIMVGIAGGSDKIRLERIAINLDDYPIVDNEGNQPIDQKIIKDAPDAYFSTLPLRKIFENLNAHQIPVQFSLSAGSYLCNHLFFQVMHFLALQNNKVPAGFIHIPPTMEIEILKNAFEIVSSEIRKSLQTLTSQSL